MHKYVTKLEVQNSSLGYSVLLVLPHKTNLNLWRFLANWCNVKRLIVLMNDSENAVPEYLPSQLHVSASLATAPPLDLEDYSCKLNDDSLGESPSSLLSPSKKSDSICEGEKCNSECGEYVQPSDSFSDSLGLSLFDAYSWSKKPESSPRRTCDHAIPEEKAQVSDVGVSVSVQQASPVHTPFQDSPRRIYCDPRLLEEDTQVSDVGVFVSHQQVSCGLSPKRHLLSAPQAFDSGCAISETSVPALPKEENSSILISAGKPVKYPSPLAETREYRTLENFDDMCKKWRSRRRAPAATAIPSSSAGTGVPAETKADITNPTSLRALNSDCFRGQPTAVEPVYPDPCSVKQMTSAAVGEHVDVVPKSYDRRRCSLSALLNTNTPASNRLCLEVKEESAKPSTSDADNYRGQPTVLEPESVRSSTETTQDIGVAVNGDYDIVRRWHNRKRIALSDITNLSSSSDSDPCKKLKQTSEKVVESVLAGPIQSHIVNGNCSVPWSGHDRPCNSAVSPSCDSETTAEDVNVNDDTGDWCDSKLLLRKLNNSRDRSIEGFLQIDNARNESSIILSSSKEMGVSKREHAEEKWSCPRRSRRGGRQRTMDAWIK